VLLPREEHDLTATIIDGVRVASTILAQTHQRATEVATALGRKPCLATVLVGDDPASRTYVRMKTNRCRTTGLDSRRHHLSVSTTTSEVVAFVRELSGDLGVDGILVQHPLPDQLTNARSSRPSTRVRMSTG
jgi:methylenetetrahydrofolate dehydrogenase (NADP+)/methenyltetrahydrofolate cyclohydrolase